jgi:hypothetical protein
MCIRLGANFATAIEDLSRAARQIAAGNLGWRTPVRSQDQLGNLSSNFNQMAIALERLKRKRPRRSGLRANSKLHEPFSSICFRELRPRCAARQFQDERCPRERSGATSTIFSISVSNGSGYFAPM